jgi:hypothetical protein
MGGDPDAESIQWDLTVVAVLDMPDTTAFTKASGWRRFEVARTPPITATSPHKNPFEVIGNQFSHCWGVPPLFQLSSD